MTKNAQSQPTFCELGLSQNICEAVKTKLELSRATLVQEKVIPLALSGRDLVVQARTGSGKTLAYLLPSIQKFLSNSNDKNIHILILVPTKELARQVASVIKNLHLVNAVNCSTEDPIHAIRRIIRETHPVVLLGTPSRICSFIEESDPTFFSSIQTVILDEADLVLGMGYLEEVQKILANVSRSSQTILASATLPNEESIKEMLLLQKPITVRLLDSECQSTNSNSLVQLAIRVKDDEERFQLLYVILKLQLLCGKMLIFVSSRNENVDRAYKLKLFLDQFGIKTCLLDVNFPLNSRHHVIDQFNRGIFDILITTGLAGQSLQDGHVEFSVARGMDFKRVDVVINFDVPSDPIAYVHQVGRTARGQDGRGTAVTLVSSSEIPALECIQKDQKERLLLDQKDAIVDYALDSGHVDAFRYRCGDAFRSITRMAVRTARQIAIRAELLASQKLKAVMSEKDRTALNIPHDSSYNIIRRPHLKHVPDYLMPAALKGCPQAPLKSSNANMKKKNSTKFKGAKKHRSHKKIQKHHNK